MVSYTTVSALPPDEPEAVYSLLHFLAGYPGWVLPTALLCGARTFLGNAAIVWSTHPVTRIRYERCAVKFTV